jgi:hypothetical protein
MKELALSIMRLTYEARRLEDAVATERLAKRSQTALQDALGVVLSRTQCALQEDVIRQIDHLSRLMTERVEIIQAMAKACAAERASGQGEA